MAHRIILAASAITLLAEIKRERYSDVPVSAERLMKDATDVLTELTMIFADDDTDHGESVQREAQLLYCEVVHVVDTIKSVLPSDLRLAVVDRNGTVIVLIP